MKQSVKRYVKNCHVCRRFKSSKNKYSELLNSLSISKQSWMKITMNFVIELSENKSFNAILMIINRLTKMHHYISCTAAKKKINAKKIARLLINHVWNLHELSNTIVSNRESQFISLVWKTICRTLKINVKLSIAFHSKTDDQSEIANQEIKRYLRNYCNYQQNDWFDWLSMTEFASNVVISVSTKLFVFMTNYDFESRISFDLSADASESIRERILTRKNSNIIDKMKDIWKFIKQRLIKVQQN
jgi:hypothetical protein